MKSKTPAPPSTSKAGSISKNSDKPSKKPVAVTAEPALAKAGKAAAPHLAAVLNQAVSEQADTALGEILVGQASSAAHAPVELGAALQAAMAPGRSGTASAKSVDSGDQKQPMKSAAHVPGQVVLVLQGGGALGAYQVGVYEAMHEAGIEPDWVIGTSIGAINGAIIAGNARENRVERLTEFWQRMQYHSRMFPGLSNALVNLATMTHGIPAFFTPNRASWKGTSAPLGVEQASYYLTDALRKTLDELVDFEYCNTQYTRLTVGAVNARTGEMRYFDSRDQPIRVEHVMASGALPPAFPAVRIDGEPYWDGGIYSNTPIEAVMNENPRLDSVIFSVQLWNPNGAEPGSILEVLGKQKDIQYASRDAHIEQERKTHRLRHIVRELTKLLPAEKLKDPEVKKLVAWGCSTTMHVVQLNAPVLHNEDHTKDIDFTPAGIRERRQAGYEETMRMIARKPWTAEVDPIEGVLIHHSI